MPIPRKPTKNSFDVGPKRIYDAFLSGVSKKHDVYRISMALRSKDFLPYYEQYGTIITTVDLKNMHKYCCKKKKARHSGQSPEPEMSFWNISELGTYPQCKKKKARQSGRSTFFVKITITRCLPLYLVKEKSPT